MMCYNSISYEDASSERWIEFITCLRIENKICERLYYIGSRKCMMQKYKEISATMRNT